MPVPSVDRPTVRRAVASAGPVANAPVRNTWSAALCARTRFVMPARIVAQIVANVNVAVIYVWTVWTGHCSAHVVQCAVLAAIAIAVTRRLAQSVGRDFARTASSSAMVVSDLWDRVWLIWIPLMVSHIVLIVFSLARSVAEKWHFFSPQVVQVVDAIFVGTVSLNVIPVVMPSVPNM